MFHFCGCFSADDTGFQRILQSLTRPQDQNSELGANESCGGLFGR